MTAFPQRLKQLELRLTASCLSDGGWPHVLDMTGTASTIVSTAQVIETLRVLGKPHDHPMVRGGLAYLATAVREHTRARAERGEYGRYPAYALWGLMRFPAAMSDPVLRDGADAAFRLLQQFERRGGGWGNHRTSTELCFPVTAVAIHALDRYRSFLNGSDLATAARLTDDARKTLAFRADGRVGGRWWSQWNGGSQCPGATALAVLALAGGDAPQRTIARDGIQWLGANPQMWSREITFDRASTHRPWKIPTFSLGLRALMHPCGRADVNGAAVPEVIAHIDELWDDTHGAWSEEPGSGASTIGSFGVVAAVQALKRAWPFDPIEHVAGRQLTRRPSQVHPTIENAGVLRRMTIDEATRRVRVDLLRSDVVVVRSFQDASGWISLLAVAHRHVDNVGSNDKGKMSVPLSELATLTGTKPDSVRHAIARVNERFATVYRLLDPHVVGGTSEMRYIIENTEIVFEPLADPPSQ
jgi:hypothetical protein